MENQITIEEFNALIKKWVGKSIKITKNELEDNDVTLIELESISYAKRSNKHDEYEPKYTVQFRGTGSVLTVNNKYEELPSSVYDLPLDDDTTYKFNGTYFILNTERGNYRIELNS